MKSERELFKQAYLNLRKGDNLPFPDSVFDEYLRLRTENGYVVVPKEPTWEMIDAGENACYGDDEHICKIVYQAMISAGEIK